MELRRIRYFVAAAEEEHFHRGAARLNIAQPALSRQIHELEAEMGIALFERVRGRVALTPAGRVFLDDARRLMRDAELARERAVRVASGKTGMLRVAVSAIASRNSIVAHALCDFQSRYPDVRLELTRLASPLQIERLRAMNVDAVFGMNCPPDLDEFAFLHVDTDNIVLIVPKGHGLARRKRVKLADLGEEPFIWVRHGYNTLWEARLTQACAQGGLKPRIVQEIDDETTMVSLVSAGMGITFAYASRREWSRLDVEFVPILDLSVRFDLELIWLAANSSPIIKNLVDATAARRKAIAPA